MQVTAPLLKRAEVRRPHAAVSIFALNMPLINEFMAFVGVLRIRRCPKPRGRNLACSPDVLPLSSFAIGRQGRPRHEGQGSAHSSADPSDAYVLLFWISSEMAWGTFS